MSVEAIILAPGECRKVAFLDTRLGFLVTGEHSKHTSFFELTAASGFDTGLHVHRVQEEFFYVVEGEFELHAGDRVVTARPGTFLFVPPGVPHAIAKPGSGSAKLVLGVSPPGHERYFEELADLLARQWPPDPAAVAELGLKYDTEQLSPLKALPKSG